MLLTILTGATLFLAKTAYSATIYTAGDSTMALGGGGAGTDGWAQYLGQYLNIPVTNLAIAGRSARSYSDEGSFDTLIADVVSGDFVVIEFGKSPPRLGVKVGISNVLNSEGHNDGTSGAVDNGREDAVGPDYNTTATVVEADGSTLVIHTFNYYVQNAVTSLLAKGAIPIVSSQTPDDIWDATNTTITAPPRFVGYAELAASNTGVAYVDHYAYVAQAYEAIGEPTVVTYYPLDHTHTSPTAANIVAEAFVRGILCGTSKLVAEVNAAGIAVPNGCL